MRFLCLHGRGTNSDILEAQLAPLRSRLQGQHTFDFVDGEGSCHAPPENISGLYPPPYFYWYEGGTPEEVRAAHDYLRAIVKEDGPYDGLIGFSEGAALAASLLLAEEEEEESRASDNNFKVAILFNSVLPLVPAGCENLRGVMSLGAAVRGHAGSYLDLLLPATAATEAAEEQEKTVALSRALCFSPEGDAKISIPTVHVIGEKDPFTESSRVVVRLCSSSPDTAQVVLHAGGHELPRDASVLDRCAELIETALVLGS